MSFFLSFEGIDGCGKTTQLTLLQARLESAGHTVVATREPGGTALAEAIRAYLLHSTHPLDRATELLLFGAARAQHVAEVILPSLERGDVVLSDRFADSSLAYQGGGLGIGMDFIRQMNAFATNGVQPTLTILLDVDPLVGLQRRAVQRGEDRIEERGLEFQRRVRGTFLDIARAEPDRVVTLDGSAPAKVVHNRIVRALQERGLWKYENEQQVIGSMKDETTSTFIGHEKRWAALARAFAKGSVPQSLLISGPPQVGKWTLARRYTQLLLCPNAARQADELPAPCGHCKVCHQVEIETFPDFRVYRPLVSAAKDEKDWVVAPAALAGSVITVEMARKFGDEAMRKPMVGPRKVMIINQADRMNIEAQNALLKTFEEPVRGLSIILLCDNPSELLPTVRSRCWHLPLGLVPDETIADWLRHEFQDAAPVLVDEAVQVAAGRLGAAWSELKRLQIARAKEGASADEASKGDEPRVAQATRIVRRIAASQPVGALGLTEEALRLARQWWAEDHVEESARDAKKSDAKVLRSAVARFLDELAHAYRAQWIIGVAKVSNGSREPANENRMWADGLDLIRKTRHYILRNANVNLALDVLFGHLIAAQIAVHGASRNADGTHSPAVLKSAGRR